MVSGNVARGLGSECLTGRRRRGKDGPALAANGRSSVTDGPRSRDEKNERQTRQDHEEGGALLPPSTMILGSGYEEVEGR